jgi:hypothetical protein
MIFYLKAMIDNSKKKTQNVFSFLCTKNKIQHITQLSFMVGYELI